MLSQEEISKISNRVNKLDEGVKIHEQDITQNGKSIGQLRQKMVDMQMQISEIREKEIASDEEFSTVNEQSEDIKKQIEELEKKFNH